MVRAVFVGDGVLAEPTAREIAGKGSRIRPAAGLDTSDYGATCRSARLQRR